MKQRLKRYVVRKLKEVLKKLDNTTKQENTTPKLTKKQIKEQKLLNEILNESGLNEGLLKERLSKAKSYGVSMKAFLSYKAWMLSDSEVWELGVALKDHAYKLHHKTQLQLDTVCARTGWDRFTAYKSMQKASNEFGYSPLFYMDMQLYNILEDNWTKYQFEKDKIPNSSEEKDNTENKQMFEQKAMDDMGWNLAQFKLAFLKAQDNCGCILSEYVNYQLYKKNPTEQRSFLSLQKQKNTKSKQVQELALFNEIVNESSLSEDVVKKRLSKAKSYGVSMKAFLSYKAWMLSDSEVWELGVALKDHAYKLHHKTQLQLDTVCARTGWDRFTAYKSMQKASNEFGYSPLFYMDMQLYNIPEDNWTKYQFEKDKIPNSSEEKDNTENKQMLEQKAMDDMGWNLAQFKLAFLKAQDNCGCILSEYVNYQLYKKNPTEQRSFLTFEKQRLLIRRRSDYSKHYMYLQNKVLFAQTFNEFIHRKSFSNQNLTFERFEEEVKGLQKIFVKPIEGSCGKGATIFEVGQSEEENREVYDKLMVAPSVIEEVISQNETMQSLNSTSINTLRINTMNIDGNIEIFLPCMRIGSGGIVDNFCANGMVSAIDKKTGIVATHAIDGNGNIYKKHPISGVAIKGFQVPLWDEIIKTAIAVAERLPEVEFVGWDFCINARGEIDLIEGNSRPMVRLGQLAFSTVDKGVYDAIEKYL